MAGNNKKAVLFTIDEEVYKELRYQKKNMSGHVNHLLRKSLFGQGRNIVEMNNKEVAGVLLTRLVTEGLDLALNEKLLKFIKDND